jgi:hypothetical protein
MRKLMEIENIHHIRVPNKTISELEAIHTSDHHVVVCSPLSPLLSPLPSTLPSAGE